MLYISSLGLFILYNCKFALFDHHLSIFLTPTPTTLCFYELTLEFVCKKDHGVFVFLCLFCHMYINLNLEARVYH